MVRKYWAGDRVWLIPEGVHARSRETCPKAGSCKDARVGESEEWAIYFERTGHFRQARKNLRRSRLATS